MRDRAVLLAAILTTVALVGCPTSGTDAAPNPIEPCGEMLTGYDLEEAEAFNPRVELVTSEGTMELVVYQAQVPFPAGTFLTHVQDGSYDETRFHQLYPDTFIQGGDVDYGGTSNRNLWGAGGQYQMPDQFHEHLRHDEPGTVSIAGTQPQQGGTQFIITLMPLPGFDDKQDVIARVVDGLDVAQRLSQLPTDERDRPEENAWLHEAHGLPAQRPADEGHVELSSYGFDCEQSAEPEGTAEFMLAVRNTGPLPLNGTVETELPGDAWDAELRYADRPVIASGQTDTFFLDVHVPEDAEHGAYPVNATFADPENETVSTTRNLTVNVGPLGPSTEQGDTIEFDFVGTLEDARPFDTTVPAYAEEDSLTWFREPAWFDDPDQLEPLQVEVGDTQLVPGIDALIERAHHGQSVTALLPPQDGYGAESWEPRDLGGRSLAVQVHVHEG